MKLSSKIFVTLFFLFFINSAFANTQCNQKSIYSSSTVKGKMGAAVIINLTPEYYTVYSSFEPTYRPMTSTLYPNGNYPYDHNWLHIADTEYRVCVRVIRNSTGQEFYRECLYNGNERYIVYRGKTLTVTK